MLPEDFEVSVEQCSKWAEKLERLCDKFAEKDDIENARLMHLCSILMHKLAFDVECQNMGGIFGPIKGGEC